MSVARTGFADEGKCLLSNDSIVTDVEIYSTARSGGMLRRSALSPAVLAGVVVTLLFSAVLLTAPRAGGRRPVVERPGAGG